MDEKQQKAFALATGGTAPSGWHDLWLGLVFVAIFAWGAWMITVQYQGMTSGAITKRQMAVGMVRYFVLYSVMTVILLVVV